MTTSLTFRWQSPIISKCITQKCITISRSIKFYIFKFDSLERKNILRIPFHNTRVRDKDCVKNRVKRAKIVRFTLC